MDRKRYPKPIGVLIDKAMDSYGHKVSLSRHSVVYLWPKLVGESVSRHAKADRVTGSVLHVEVDSSVWMNELAAVKSVLLEKVNSQLEPGAAPITDIRYKQRSWAVQEREPDKPEPKIPPPNEDEIRRVEEMLAPVEDPELRSLLERILEKDRRARYRRRPPEDS